MFRQYEFKLVETKPAIKISELLQLNVGSLGIESVVTKEKKLVIIDWADNFLVEFIGKYDKQGFKLFTGDIVELDDAAIADLKANCGMANDGLTAGIYLIGWAQGGFNAQHIKEQKGFFLFEEPIVMRTNKIGNQFENTQIVIDALKPVADEKLKDTDGEINATPQA